MHYLVIEKEESIELNNCKDNNECSDIIIETKIKITN